MLSDDEAARGEVARLESALGINLAFESFDGDNDDAAADGRSNGHGAAEARRRASAGGGLRLLGNADDVADDE